MIIGLSGKGGAGKDTFAEFLKPYGYERIALADPLKSIAKAIFGFTEEQVSNPVSKEEIDERWGKSPRQLLQELGRKMREIHPEVWIRPALQHMGHCVLNSKCSNFVITDVRFPNEAEVVHRLGGFLVRIDRPGTQSRTGAQDESELALDDYTFDARVCNAGTLEDLEVQAQRLVLNYEGAQCWS